MNLPIFWPDIPGQNFDCQGCTRCCRELVVHLTPEDRAKIDRQKWGGKIEGEPYLRLGANHVLRHKAAGGCVFLSDDGKCRIHAEFGAKEKPLACQLYPFTLEAGAAVVNVGIRFDCPTVSSSGGGPIAPHRREVKRLSDELQQAKAIKPPRAEGAVEIVRGVRLEAARIDPFIAHVEKWLRTESIPLGKRLYGLFRLAHTLNQAKFARLDESSAGELVVMLAAGIREVAEDTWSQEPRPPTAREMTLLRQAVFSHCEHVTFAQIVAPLWPSVKTRWGQLRRAGAMGRGRGGVPAIRGVEGMASFEAVDRVAADPRLSDRDVSGLVVRWLVARLEGRVVFGPGYYEYSVAEGLAAMLVGVCCAGWLARCIAATDGRGTFSRGDVEKSIGLVDRGAGRVPELGARSGRLRVRYLLEGDGVARLLTMYSVAAYSAGVSRSSN